MRQWFPEYYVDDAAGRSMPKASSAAEVLLIVLVLEHCLIAAAMLVSNAVPSTPQSVNIEIQKYQWYHESLASEARHLSMKRNSAQIVDALPPAVK